MNPYRTLVAVTRLLAARKISMTGSRSLFLAALSVFALTTLMVGSAGWAQEANQTPAAAPLNARFVDSVQNQLLGRTSLVRTTPEGHTLGYRSSPMDMSHLIGQPGLAAQTTASLPSSYDLRNYGKVSPVKNQLLCGDCWAFATYGSMESVLLAEDVWHFSENNLNNLSGFDIGSCQGGNGQMSTAYLARWAGPINASADPDPTSCSSTNNCSLPSSANLPAQLHVQGVYFIAARANSADNSNLKTAIMNYGGVDAAISADELGWVNPYWNANNDAYYYNGASVCTGSNGKAAECPVDHAITLVGWDDNYPSSKFSTPPPGNGAFLVKNSWGTEFGDEGFFWISYYDVQLAVEESYVFNDNASTTNFTTQYEYDPLGLVSAEGYGTTTAWAANIFTAGANGQLSAVATYALANSTAYSIEVYTNASSGPISGTLATTASGTIALAGYNTIELPSPVTLTSGQKFSVVIKLTTPGYDYPVPVEYAINGYSSKAKASPGQSYISSNGSTWQDTTTIVPTMNVALKGFSIDSAEPALSAALTAATVSGSAPLATQFTATAGGTASGTINYLFWWNCSNTSTSVTTVEAACGTLSASCSSTATGFMCDGQSQKSYSVSNTYATAGSYTAKVIIEQGSAPPAQAQLAIQVNPAPPAATPTFTPVAGTYTSAQSVTIKDATANATIYYTTNGSAPNTSSTKYTGPIVVSATETVQAIATAPGFTQSAAGSAAYVIQVPAATPTFTPVAGTYSSAQSVTIKDATANATIYYTTNGSAPNTSSTKYTGPIVVGATETVQAIATAPGFTQSAAGTAAYVIGTSRSIKLPGKLVN